jgi:hypothetical protein
MNAFLELANRQIAAPVKARQRAAEKRALRAAGRKAIAERRAQFRLAKKADRERHTALLVGPHGEAARNFAAFLKAMTLDDAPALIEYVRRQSWLDADKDARFLVLAMIDATIIKLRERAGMATFDDDLADPPSSVFLIIREVLS